MKDKSTDPRPRVVTLTYLQGHAAQVIEEMNDSGQPVAVTDQGRFVALMHPVKDREIVESALQSLIEQMPAEQRLSMGIGTGAS